MRDGKNLGSDSTFQEMRQKWNAVAKGDLNGIYYKTKTHLAKYYKTWRQNQMHQTIYHRADLQNLLSVLQYVPQVSGNNTIDDTVQSQSFGRQQNAPSTDQVNKTSLVTTTAMSTMNQKRMRKECKLCKNLNCNGGYKQK